MNQKPIVFLRAIRYIIISTMQSIRDTFYTLKKQPGLSFKKTKRSNGGFFSLSEISSFFDFRTYNIQNQTSNKIKPA
jgi:hypothetical protein